MDSGFIDIVKNLVSTKGKDVLVDPKFKNFLADDTKNEYKKESEVFLKVLKSECYAAIANASDVESICPKIVQRLEKDEFIAEQIAGEIVDLLVLVLRGVTVSTLPKIPQLTPSTATTPTITTVPVGVSKNTPVIPVPIIPKNIPPQPVQTPFSYNYNAEVLRILSIARAKPSTSSPAASPMHTKKRNLLVGAVILAVIAVGIYFFTQPKQDSVAPIVTELVWIQGGTFTMGSPASEPGHIDREAQHQVTVNSFYMGEYEVTQHEYREVMGTNRSEFKGPNLPVENVSWYDAVEYCNKLSQKEGLTPAYTRNKWTVTWNRNANGYRLPTEAEWEYACRAGTTTPFNTGNNITTDQANYDGNYPYNNNEKGEDRGKTTDVGSFEPNAWGLYDMHGNVMEWCWDRPSHDASGPWRVHRGGAWGFAANDMRSARYSFDTPRVRAHDGGFRIVRP